MVAVMLTCFFLFDCNKSINQQSNKARILVTNAVIHGQPLAIAYDNVSLLSGGLLEPDSTTGIFGNPYLLVGAGIHNFRASTSSGSNLLNGNIAVQANQSYSVFLYDSVTNGQLNALVLKDNLFPLADSISGVRFLNLSPDTVNLEIFMTTVPDTGGIDTVFLGFYGYVGPDPIPANYSRFSYIHSGKYGIIVALDSTDYIHIDSLTFGGGKTYTIFTQGFYHGTGADTLRAMTVDHN